MCLIFCSPLHLEGYSWSSGGGSRPPKQGHTILCFFLFWIGKQVWDCENVPQLRTQLLLAELYFQLSLGQLDSVDAATEPLLVPPPSLPGFWSLQFFFTWRGTKIEWGRSVIWWFIFLCEPFKISIEHLEDFVIWMREEKFQLCRLRV